MSHSNPTNLLPTLFVTLLTLTPFVTALPTTAISTTALHPCSVFVQRWCQNCQERFDVDYYNVAWTTPWHWPVAPVFSQTSTLQNVPSPGSQLVPHTLGSHPLLITNTADASSSVGGDPGKLSFAWGDQRWDSFSSGTPCTVSRLGQNTAGYSGSVDVECAFQCDA